MSSGSIDRALGWKSKRGQLESHQKYFLFGTYFVIIPQQFSYVYGKFDSLEQ